MSDTKVCSKCKEEKPRSEFFKDRTKRDGLYSQCKVCRKQYRQENLGSISGYNKQYYQENKEQKKQWHQENRKRILEYKKQYRQENLGSISGYNKQYYQENKEKYIVYKAKRRALKQDGIPETLRDCPVEKERVVQIYKLRDLLAKATGIQYHVDHIWPLSKGGPHWSGNLQIITAEENLSKGDSFCEDTARVIQESLNENTCS